MLERITRCYWRLCLLRESPENTPYSPFLMALAGFLFFMLIIFQWRFAATTPVFSFLTGIFAAFSLLLSYLFYTYVLLKLLSLSERLVQTTTSLWAAHFIIHVLAFPLLILTPYLAEADMSSPVILLLGIVYLLTTLGLSVWQFIITVHIYRYAMGVSVMQAVLAGVGLLAFNILTVSFWR